MLKIVPYREEPTEAVRAVKETAVQDEVADQAGSPPPLIEQRAAGQGGIRRCHAVRTH